MSVRPQLLFISNYTAVSSSFRKQRKSQLLLMALSGYVTYSRHWAMRPFKRENYKTKKLPHCFSRCKKMIKINENDLHRNRTINVKNGKIFKIRCHINYLE